ncbi:hypothetical protein [Marinicella litoralis]|uniref:Uncharacterized protein n=2 Tax=Marinicella litoralis TaxID=644220 RepID=A0A4R6XJT3_9GAMM|nr:hypothetical protein [Marinicella litoralis]TDR17493.1 hypothetical protein C8D91_2552 [Marinicella litoralis]
MAIFMLTGASHAQLPDNPNDWVCSTAHTAEIERKSAAWCDANKPNLTDLNWRLNVGFVLEPGQMTDLDKKNAFDRQLRNFLRSRVYASELKWAKDLNWRMTGPYVGEFGQGQSYGVHPAVRVYYSPEMVDWMCSDRKSELVKGAMIIKEMASIDQKLGIVKTDDCMHIPDDKDRLPDSWTVMYRTDVTHDQWYWANPTNTPKVIDAVNGDGNPPIIDKSAFTWAKNVPNNPVTRNQAWYPTGYAGSSKINTVVYPYSLYGAACINCHATAESQLTFSSLDNVVSEGLQYKWYPEKPEKSTKLDLKQGLHRQVENSLSTQSKTKQSPFSQPLSSINKAFVDYYGELGINQFNQAWNLRLPAESFDHHLSRLNDLDQYLTSDQCINCHDATYANSAEANMLIDKANSDSKINVSPYGEWRVSPMGLAGRDPIFFSQLQSETNNLPAAKKCIENTCLHCHGVMGQRQYAIDSGPSDECKSIFAVAPPEGVPFGKPFAKSTVTRWQDNLPNNHDAQYGALARDGISCMVCHQINNNGLGTEAGYTGNFVTNEPGTVVGPYDSAEVIQKPMQNALGITPEFGQQIQNSDICGSCHNILLPTYNNDGTAHYYTAPDGQKVNATYEQTTHLEWVNSDFSKKQDFQSCQDCHMPTEFKVGDTHNDLKGMKIANIESNDFAPTTHRLPDKDITLTPRDEFARHSLHGLNVFINEMFQQFPMILGLRQMDYMVNSNVQPALITGRDSMIEMAEKQTAAVNIEQIKPVNKDTLTVDVEVKNLTGHFLPSGVGFRRVFIETIVYDQDDQPLWASGRTNELGVILDGLTDKPLLTEQGGKDKKLYQPHYEVISAPDQVQIYQEIIQDSAGHNTTSFLRRVADKKDNRIRGKGFDPQFFLDNQSPYIQMLGVLIGNAANDADYYDKSKTGSDHISYQIKLSEAEMEKVSYVTVNLFNQSIPPAYLQDRFSDAHIGPGEKEDIQRLFYLTSHLNTETITTEGKQPIKDWKFYLTGHCKQIDQSACQF